MALRLVWPRRQELLQTPSSTLDIFVLPHSTHVICMPADTHRLFLVQKLPKQEFKRIKPRKHVPRYILDFNPHGLDVVSTRSITPKGSLSRMVFRARKLQVGLKVNKEAIGMTLDKVREMTQLLGNLLRGVELHMRKSVSTN